MRLYKIAIVTLTYCIASMWCYDKCGLATNVFVKLANKRFNEVAYPTAHNAQSYKRSIVQNQDLSIPEQLEAGIRAFKLPIWYDYDINGRYYACVCHGISKDLMQSITDAQILSQIPFLMRSRVQKILQQLKPVLPMVTDALVLAYGQSDDTFGMLPFRHSMFDPAALPLEKVCSHVAAFLKKYPHEILTLILEDFTYDLPLLADAFQKTGLSKYAHAQEISQPWPTIASMVARNKRLVIFLRSSDNAPYNKFPWMNPLWAFAWDTKWQFYRARDFLKDEVPNRGKNAYEMRKTDPNNKIFIVYHFITPFAGGSKKWACRVNRAKVLKWRLHELQKRTGHIPNFVQVDFFQYPHNDIFKVINELNGIT